MASSSSSAKSDGSNHSSHRRGYDGGYNDNEPSFTLPPAYDLHRSDRININDNRPPSSFATTEDSINSSLDYSSSVADEQYEGFRRLGGGPRGMIGSSPPLSPVEYPSTTRQQVLQDIDVNNDVMDSYYSSNGVTGTAEDATAIIHKMHGKLLHLLSHPELFHDALTWEDDPPLLPQDKFEEDSTFEGLSDANNNNEDNIKVTQNETFEFDPSDNKGGGEKAGDKKRNDGETSSPPLPFEIFAADAEVVLPQALTATQLFGVERKTGIELEAAAGIAGLSHLFLRWLALMPDGDHMNVINPPGLTVMRIAGGGYRVTAAHRVVWRWMNKFSFSNNNGGDVSETDVSAAALGEDVPLKDDFDFGDLVTMTIIDVFETDVDGKLLSYCPTFDNRAVHKTQEVTERIRKGASQFKETIQVIAKSPAGKRVNKAAGNVGRIGMKAALHVGSIVKSKIEEIGADELKKQQVRKEKEQVEEMVYNEITEENPRMEV